MLLSLDAGYALTIPEMELPQPNNEIMNNIHTLLLAGCLFVALAGSLQAQIPDSVIRVPAAGVDYVRFSMSGSYFLTGQDDTIRVWSVLGAQEVGVPFKMGGNGGYAAFLPGDTAIVTAVFNADSVFKVWNWRTGQVVKTVHVFRPLQGAVLSGDGKRMAINVLYPAKQIEYWDIEKEQYQGVVFDAKDGVQDFQIDSAGKIAIVKQGLPSRLYRILLESTTLDTLSRVLPVLDKSVLSRDGSLIACTMTRRRPIIYKAATLDSLYALDVPVSQSMLVSLDFCGGADRIVTITRGSATRKDSAQLELWDAKTGTRIALLSTDSTLGGGVVYGSPRGDYVILANHGSLLLWPIVRHTNAVAGDRIAAPLSLQMYPNPASDYVSVAYKQVRPGRVSIAIVSVNGRSVFVRGSSLQPSGEHIHVVHVDGIPSGAYLCVMDTPDGRVSLPITIWH